MHALHPACEGLTSVATGCSSTYSTSQWASSQDVQNTNSYSLGASGEYDGAKVGTACRQCADSTNEVPAPFPCVSRHVLCRLNVTVYTVRAPCGGVSSKVFNLPRPQFSGNAKYSSINSNMVNNNQASTLATVACQMLGVRL